MKQYFCVGTYTEPILFGTGEVFQGKGKGVLICSLADGEVEVISSVLIKNPSYLCLDEDRKKIYAVNEMKEYQGAFGGGLTQLAYDEVGVMRVERSGNVGGTDPCHVLLVPGGGFLSVANYGSGSVSVVPIDSEGNIETPHPALHPTRRQASQVPHAHATIAVPGENRLLVADLGLDTMYGYRYDGQRVEPDISAAISVPAGSGPRTGVFSKDGADLYVVCEMSSQVIHFKQENGMLRRQEAVSTLVEGNGADNTCADIHLTPDGAYLFVSNRGDDSLVSFKREEDGSLTFVQRQDCQGKTPRNFAIDPTGAWLLCGNQDSDTISIFKMNGDGTLSFVKAEHFGAPVCIRFFQRESFKV